jgi:hypothetical protein
MIDWVKEHLNERFELPRPRLLAMIRFIDTNRDGLIDLAEFRMFHKSALQEMEEEKKRARKAVKRWVTVHDEDDDSSRGSVSRGNSSRGSDLDEAALEKRLSGQKMTKMVV